MQALKGLPTIKWSLRDRKPVAPQGFVQRRCVPFFGRGRLALVNSWLDCYKNSFPLGPRRAVRRHGREDGRRTACTPGRAVRNETCHESAGKRQAHLRELQAGPAE